ncbi:MAG: BatD family protein, partial [Desulfamplus sp.]|nr:BatD family protein [Desulfamplus sp.]
MSVYIAAMLMLIPVEASPFAVSAQVDRNKISLNESITLGVVCEDGEGDVDTSKIKDFNIISKSTSSSISIVNGTYSKTVTSIFHLVPRKEGILEIPPLNVTHGKKIYKTNPISIEVTGAHVPRDGTRDIFLQAGISSTDLYHGQQAVYQLRLYSAVRYSNASLQRPSFKGFTAKEAGERENYQERLNSRLYNVIAINYVLIPEVTGDLEIDPAVITCDVPVKGRSGDPFADPFFSNNIFSFGRSETRRFSTTPVSVTVKPLPPYAGYSAPFSGVVGRLDMEARLDRNQLTAGESVTLTVTLSGEGNIMDASLPELLLPPDLKVYEDTPVEEIGLTREGYAGKKIYRRAVVPVREGRYEIPPISLTFFDVESGEYRLLSTSPMVMDVLPQAGFQAGGTDASGSGEYPGLNSFTGLPGQGGTSVLDLESGQEGIFSRKRSVEFTGKDILALKEGSTVFAHKKRWPLPLFLSLFILPGLIFAIFKLFLLLGRRELSHGDVMMKKAGESLKRAENALKSSKFEPEEFFRFLHTALTARVLARGGMKGESLTSGEVADILTSSGCEGEVVMKVNALLTDIESARYGSAGNHGDFQDNLRKDNGRYRLLFDKTRKIIKMLGMAVIFCTAAALIPPHGAGAAQVSPHDSGAAQVSPHDSGAAQVSPHGAGTAQVSPHDSSARYDPSMEFVRGVDAYNNGEYKASAEIFTSIAAKGIHNPYLYYNIGNAFLKAGRTGDAILWYERAKKEIPFDPDLRFNLEYARGFVKDKPEASGFDLSAAFFFLQGYLPSEAIKYCAVLFSFIFFVHAGVRTLRGKRIFTTPGTILFAVWL